MLMFLILLGRYFGVVASWHWKDIVDTIKRHYPEYSVPPCNYEDEDMKVSLCNFFWHTFSVKTLVTYIQYNM